MEEILHFIEENDLEGFLSHLSTMGSISNMKDETDCTLIHAAVIYLNFDILEKLIQHVN
jgi:hypothetical protein